MTKHLAAWLALTVSAFARPEDPVAVAYYFPNWHREPGQTGETFGEWGSLPRAVPRFLGHEQPKRPVWGIEDVEEP